MAVMAMKLAVTAVERAHEMASIKKGIDGNLIKCNRCGKNVIR